MKKGIYALILLLVVLSGLALANSQMKKETPKAPDSRPLTAAEMKAERLKWEASPDGIKFKEWEASPKGQKVYASEAKIRTHLRDSSNMEAVITSLSLPPGSRLGFGIMVNIDGADFILRFDAENSQMEQLGSLKVGDKIIVRSRYVSHAPKYEYPILGSDYVERDGKLIFKRIPRKGGC